VRFLSTLEEGSTGVVFTDRVAFLLRVGAVSVLSWGVVVVGFDALGSFFFATGRGPFWRGGEASLASLSGGGGGAGPLVTMFET